MSSDSGPEEGFRTALHAPVGRKPETNGRGRITANSFRILTEKLKRSGAAVAAHAEPTVPLAAPVAVAVDFETVADQEPTFIEIAAPIQAVHQQVADVAPEIPVFDEVPASIPVFGLPVFQPLTPFAPLTPATPESTEVLEPEGTFEEMPAAIEAAPEIPVFEPVVETAGFAPGVLEQAEPEPTAVETEVHLAGDEPLAEIEAAAEATEVEPGDQALAAELEPVVEPDAQQWFAETETVVESETAIEARAEFVSDPEPEPEPEPAEPASAPEEVAEPEASTPVEEASAEVPDEVPAAADSTEESRTISTVTGRVVDAMLKTIADAVYAKPSATERALFLKDMAELVEQGAFEMTEAAAPSAPAPMPAPVQQEAPTEPLLQADPTPANLPLRSVIAARIGPASSLLRSTPKEPDLFAKDVSSLILNDPKPLETAGADEETGALALSLLDMMSAGAGTALPQERALAADTLLRILSRIPVKQLLNVAERVAIMAAPPPLLVAKLIRDPRPEVVAPLLERCMHITDQDLMAAATEGDMAKQRMIARRRVLSPVLADHLIALHDPSVVLTLIRNPGASFSHDAFYELADMASKHHGLLAPLATRADLPPPVAFELFWYVPQELRRFIFSRFLTDSETLNKILRITLATHEGDDGEAFGNDAKFPAGDLIDGALDLAASFRLDEAAQTFSEIGGVSKDTAMRILADREGEPLTVLLKAMGYQRGKFSDAMEKLRNSESGIIRPERVIEELQGIFDGLSFNKARILLTYWDWFVRKAGPYAPRN